MSPSPESLLTAADLKQLRAAGIDQGEASRQIALLRSAQPFTRIERACSVGDGIRRLNGHEHADLEDAFRGAAREGRCSRFVPASGAATRMFRSLLAYLAKGAASRKAIAMEAGEGLAEALEARRFLDNIDRFAFHRDLVDLLSVEGADPARLLAMDDAAPLLDALLSAHGLGSAGSPKALLEFHDYPEGARTAFEEHLIEGSRLVRDGEGRSRIHFTVAESERERFDRALQVARARCEALAGGSLDVEFSTQKASTDTLAVDDEGQPFRAENGSLLLRPSGHGALIENLHEVGGDLVLIKNIDNVVPDRLKEPTYLWSRLLGGLAVRLRERTTYLIEKLRDVESDRTAAVAEALAFTKAAFHREPTSVEAAIQLLDRPIRVCGMVINTGEPGGGPFWVRESGGGMSLQIVETAQIDPGSPEQKALLSAATHTNPVFIACSVRNGHGRPYDLRRWVDPSAVIITRKSHGGRGLKALERPGLWNGAMAGWNTVFVEVPLEVFNPVKTVIDLLRETHQP